MTTTTTATTTITATVDRFLDAVAAGQGIPDDLYAPDAVLDATPPNWRMTVRGADAIAAEYARWFHDPAQFEELTRHPIAGGEVVTYLLTWTENGVPHAAHHCHVIGIAADGRVEREQVFCGGRWDAAMLAEMAAADNAG
jgi:hypothetical protein